MTPNGRRLLKATTQEVRQLKQIAKQRVLSKVGGQKASLTHSILVNSFTVICWVSPCVILGVSGLFCNFCSIFDEKFC